MRSLLRFAVPLTVILGGLPFCTPIARSALDGEALTSYRTSTAAQLRFVPTGHQRSL
jgi:hypothetical protein